MLAPSLWFIPSFIAHQRVGVLSQNAPTSNHQCPGRADIQGVPAAAVGLDLSSVIPQKKRLREKQDIIKGLCKELSRGGGDVRLSSIFSKF